MWNGEHEVLWSRAAGTRWTRAPAKAILVFGANRPHPPMDPQLRLNARSCGRPQFKATEEFCSARTSMARCGERVTGAT
eukprot:5171399-Prymnesium_polylepis.1